MADGYLIGENLRRKLGEIVKRGEDLMSAPSGRKQLAENFQQSLQRPPNFVFAKNTSGQPVPMLGVLEFESVVTPPNGSDVDENDDFVWGFECVGIMPNGTRPFGVAMEPIPVNGIGRLAIGGTFACKVKVLADTHGYARSRKNDVTQLISAECGPMRLVWKQAKGNDKFGVVVA